MKKIISLKLVTAFLAVFVHMLSSAVNQVTYIPYYTSAPTIGTDTLDGVTYATFRYGDLYNDGSPGMPSLPVDFISFSVPYNATNFTVSTTPRVWTSYNLGHLLYPCQTDVYTDGSTTPPITFPDSTAYFSGSSFPSEIAWVVNEGFLDGENHIVTVALMPFIYQHTSTSDIVRKAHHVYVTLNYELRDSLTMYPIVREDSALREEGYRLTQSMVVNPSQVASFSYSYNPPGPIGPGNPIDPNGGLLGNELNGGLDPGDPQPGDPGNIGYGGELQQSDTKFPYLIVTTNELYNSLHRLAAIKRQKGYNVKIVSMDQVMNDPDAKDGDRHKQPNGTYQVAFNDSAGVLRQFLKNYYSFYGTKYVLLAGIGVPYRTVSAIHPSGDKITDFPTDLYYSDLNTFWYPDMSTHNRELDRFPELYVGRILADDEQLISNYTDKLFRYELNPGKGDYSYLKWILYTEGLDMNKNHIMPELDYHYRTIFNNNRHLAEREHELYPSGDIIVDSINTRKFGYMSLLNHACPSGFIVYGYRENYNDEYPHLYLWAIDTIHNIHDGIVYNLDSHINNGFNNMQNKYYPNICYSIGCTTIPYDKAPGYETVQINCGESFTIGKDYGGPAFLGYTRKGSLGSSPGLEKEFVKQLKAGHLNVGKAEALSKFKFNLNNYLCMAHNLIGEPEFQIWSDIPQGYSNISISRNDQSISISGIDEDSTNVALCANDGRWLSFMVSSNVTLTGFSSNSPIMIYKYNRIPYIAPLLLQNISINKSQYIIASDVLAGRLIDNNRTSGDVTVKDGTRYEIAASGTVTLQGGFMVEKGADFIVSPSCY